MSDAETPLSELSHDQLAERVERLEERVGELERSKADGDKVATRTQLNHLIARLTECDIEDFTTDPVRHLSAVEDIGDRFRAVETLAQRHESIVQERHTPQGSGPEEHWWNVVEYAHNVEDQAEYNLPGSWVPLYKEDVAAATGVSERRAGQLIDQWVGKAEGHEQKTGTRFQPYQRASAGSNHSAKRKAIKIDLDVWGSPE